MTARPKVFKLCQIPHECHRCHSLTMCKTYMYWCPWLRNDTDNLCEDCMTHTLTGEAMTSTKDAE